MIRSVDDLAVHSLLSTETNVTYAVPPYQREYAWGKDQWDALFDDLVEEGVASAHFLGTIICVNKTHNSTSQTILELVDGQQRMTTLSILLLALHNSLALRQSHLDDEQRADSLGLRKMLTLRGRNGQRLRLQKQNNNADDYEYLLNKAGFEVDAARPTNVGKRRISRAHKHFLTRINSYLQLHPTREVDALFDLVAMAKQAVMVKIEVDSYADAFTLFESLNNRGLPLTPIDLIKTSLLSKASQTHGEASSNRIYDSWTSWLAALGDESSVQERFFRQFYNAFKNEWSFGVAGIPVATKSKLIRIYDSLLEGDLDEFERQMSVASEAYGRIIGNLRDDEESSDFDHALRDLGYAQGAPSFTLLLFLLVQRNRFGLDDKDFTRIANLLVSFSIRRNLTNTPPTYDLDRIFISIVEGVSGTPNEIIDFLRAELRKVSASEADFETALRGPMYEDNVGATRFALVKLAEHGMTSETWQDLWERQKSGTKDTYKWTIEHVLPQGENLPPAWVEMLGGAERAREIQGNVVHTLGNLTITAFNSTLSNKSFDEKRDRVDNHGRFVGYRNGLNLNEDLANQGTWSEEQIQRRTDKLVASLKDLFAL